MTRRGETKKDSPGEGEVSQRPQLEPGAYQGGLDLAKRNSLSIQRFQVMANKFEWEKRELVWFIL